MKRLMHLIFRGIVATLSIILIAIVSSIFIIYLTLPDVRSLAQFNPATTAFIEIRRTEALKANREFLLQWKWIPPAQVSPNLKNVLLYTEDPIFWSHSGINWNLLKQAFWVNWKEKRLK